jgi:hypothetical protein
MLKVFDFLPTPLNAANDISPSGFYNSRTYQQTNAGGLTLGDAVDFDDAGAANQSNTATGLLYQGRYRRVRVSANATAANVAKGLAAFVQPGSSLLGALVLTAGSGQAAGVYQVLGTGGGGTGAIISVIVGAGGTVTTQPTVVAGGEGYTSAPTFTLAAGGTPATFQAQMAENSYIVTDFATTGVVLQQPRGIFLNSVTPGNYGWIQEDGIGTVLYAATVTASTVGNLVAPKSASAGAFDSTVATTYLVGAFGTAIDKPIGATYGRIVMNLPVWNG